jgi:uncharacterized protein YciI
MVMVMFMGTSHPFPDKKARMTPLVSKPPKVQHCSAGCRCSIVSLGQGIPPCVSPSKRRRVGDTGGIIDRIMFVIELIYKAELSAIDARMAAHVKFLKKYYASGNFLISGRKIPRNGGIILAVAKTRSEIEAIVQEDPFHVHGLADFRIIEFRASQRADDIQKRMDSG